MQKNSRFTNPLLPVPTDPLKISSSTDREDSSIKLSLIIPTFNEKRNIKAIVEKLTYLLNPTLSNRYELIIVDDNSPDRTWEIAQSILPDYPQLRVMRRQEERGLSTAVIRGWQVARGEVLGVIDADLQHPPETLLKLWIQIEQGADLAVASRHVEKGGVSDWSIIRRFLSRGAQVLGLVILPGVVGRVSDPMSGYFLVRRNAILDKVMNPAGYKILIEVLGRGNIRWIGEVGYVFQERQEGESKVTRKQYIEYIQHLLRLRFARWSVAHFMRFGIVGFSGIFVDLALFYMLRTLLGLGLTRSTIFSSEIAIIHNFLWNDLWTFRAIAGTQQGWQKRFKRGLKFNFVCLAGLILNVLIVNGLFNFLGMNEYIAKLIAIAIVTPWNFWINLKLKWRVTEVD
ncbi:glycosyltransferase [Lusitaniella coriacea LEGE 07157]|uniref:Dolichol-phosphate mannosyltransferase n=1 Tax=Lusitaniella coriacea LEGE 07157 TaxID=945747 RepID=A0A8J7J6M2_9CYAN|nr:glycosyltransferase family 2 protein [Lusitaniella coriacea]MBE9118789.1 glycosyltransferase [Lusitaniella coriacea LEGE 07157]